MASQTAKDKKSSNTLDQATSNDTGLSSNVQKTNYTGFLTKTEIASDLEMLVSSRSFMALSVC